MIKQGNSKVLPELLGPRGGADLRLGSPQPDTSIHCEAMNMGLVNRMVCLFLSSHNRYQIILLGDKGRCI